MIAPSESDLAGPRSDSADDPAVRFVVGGTQRHPLRAAAVVSSALAAGAGVYFGTRALARRNAAPDGRISSVMATAITACDLKETSGHKS